MSLLVKRNGDAFPSLVDEFFNTDKFFAPLFPEFYGGLSKGFASKLPSANITESNSEFKIELAAPGLGKEDFKVEVNDDILTISAEKTGEKKEEKENIHRQEFSYTSFTRSFQLPQNAVSDKIEAKYENGLLKLTLPKKEISTSKPKKEIKVA